MNVAFTYPLGYMPGDIIQTVAARAETVRRAPTGHGARRGVCMMSPGMYPDVYPGMSTSDVSDTSCPFMVVKFFFPFPFYFLSGANLTYAEKTAFSIQTITPVWRFSFFLCEKKEKETKRADTRALKQIIQIIDLSLSLFYLSFWKRKEKRGRIKNLTHTANFVLFVDNKRTSFRKSKAKRRKKNYNYNGISTTRRF